MGKARITTAGLGLLLVVLIPACGGGGDNPPLTFTGIEPAEGAQDGGTEVTLTGSGFIRLVDRVSFGRYDATSLRVLNDTTLRCVTPRGTVGPCDVEVVNAKAAVVMEGVFTYLPPPPTLTGVTPDEGPPGVSTTIRLTGSQFTYEPVSVELDGRSCTNVEVESDSVITCKVPSIRSGQDLAVTVTTGGGTASLPDAFSYLVYPYQGTYFFVQFDGLTLDAAPAARTRWGTLLTDGEGIHTGGQIWTNDQGLVTGPTVPAPTAHQMDEDRRFTWGSASSPELVGRISTDGGLAVLGSVRVGVQPSLLILGRVEGGPYDDTSLSGAWHAGAVFGDGSTRGAIWGTTTFDGVGGAASEFDYNLEGGVFGPIPGSDTYSVSSDGGVTLDLVDTDLTLEGQILQGGDLVILAGGAASPEFPVVVVLVRAGSTAGPTTFSGNYAFAAMVRGNPAWDANTGTLESDGDGTGTVLDLLGHDGNVNWTDWPESPYDYASAVAPDGLLEIFVDGGAVGGGGMDTQGAILPGGDFGFLAGSRLLGERPMLWFLLR